jgi:N-acetylglucosamine-6-sulfatase
MRRPTPNLIAVLLVVLAAGCVLAPCAAAARPNILLILTDDQRWDTVGQSMPTVEQELGGHGVTFTNAFAVNPLCCPSRATILTGRYSHSTGVYGNAPPYGGSGWFEDDSTIATWLRKAGYRTGFVGKYLNGYGGAWAPPTLNRWFVPPGWDRWFGFDGGYYDYHVSANGMNILYGTSDADYSTDVFTREAVSFLDAPSTAPFFLVYAPYAPHAPVGVPARHGSAFAGIPPWRPPAFDEADTSDKPSWVRIRQPLTPEETAKIDEMRRLQLASQLAVDDGVDAILGSLRASGRMENTMVVFLSDNGLLWGEHRIWNRKNSAFEESIRVPLVIRYDPLVDAPRSNDRLVGNVDLAPTFAALAGIKAPGAEGRSLLPLLGATAADPPPWRTRLLVEHLRGAEGAAVEVPTFCAVRTDRYKYVAYATREEELYDLVADPAELVNRAADPTLRTELLGLRADVRRLCNPPPPGFDLEWLCTLEPAAGAAVVLGTPAGDTICGRKAGELLAGRGGNDTVRGAAGHDRLVGEQGADQLLGGPGHDVLDGGPGDDILLARDGERDEVTCGKGLDLVYADKRDRIARSCERVHRFRH